MTFHTVELIRGVVLSEKLIRKFFEEEIIKKLTEDDIKIMMEDYKSDKHETTDDLGIIFSKISPISQLTY